MYSDLKVTKSSLGDQNSQAIFDTINAWFQKTYSTEENEYSNKLKIIKMNFKQILDTDILSPELV